MKLFNEFALTTLLLLGSSSLLFAKQPQVHRNPISKPAPQLKQAPPQTQQDFVNAVIRSIDRQRGVLDVDSEIGWMQIQLTPEEVEALQVKVGDTIQVRVLNSEMNVS